VERPPDGTSFATTTTTWDPVHEREMQEQDRECSIEEARGS
jgi:hypothetical protein